MSSDKNKSGQVSSHDLWMVSQAAGYLTNQACTVSARHLQDGMLRLQFNREVAYYARGVVQDVEVGRKSVEQGLIELKQKQRSLLDQSIAFTRQGVGLVAGGLQFKTGVEICVASFGTLCVIAGVPIMAHGANNFYESGRNLWEGRTDTEGPLRNVYRQAAVALGGEKEAGDVAYGVVDISTSLYSMLRLVRRPDAWRLYRYIRTDYVRSYRSTSVTSIALDSAVNYFTVKDSLEKWEILNE